MGTSRLALSSSPPLPSAPPSDAPSGVSTPFSATVIPCPAGFSGLFPTDAADATAPAISALSSDGLQTASTSSFLQPAQQDLASGRKRPLESGNDTSRASTNKARRLINLPDGNQLGIYRTLKACFGEWTDHDALPRPIQKLLHADRVNINSLNKSGHTVLYKELLRGLGQQGLSPEARKHQVRRIEALLENGAHLSDEDLSTYVVDFSAYRSVMSRRDAAFAELIMRIRGDGERTAYPFNFERNLVVHLLSAEPLDEILFKEVRAIVEGGCDLNRPTGNVFASAGDTYPIHELAAEKRPEAIRFLLQHGASLYVRDGRGRPPLFWASDRETIKVLLQAGADPEAMDDHGENVFTHAIECGYELDVILEFFRMVDNAEDSSPVGALIGHLLRPEREPMNKSLEERFDERVEDFRSGGGDSALRLLSQTRLTESESRDPQIVTFHRRLSHRLGA